MYFNLMNDLLVTIVFENSYLITYCIKTNEYFKYGYWATELNFIKDTSHINSKGLSSSG